MRVTVDPGKSLEENAEAYFARAKKARAKLEGALAARERMRAQADVQERRAAQAAQEAQLKRPEERWYHKYRWSLTRSGHLLVAGQNADANEALIKHHTEPGDIVFHTDMAGSPFTLLKPHGDVTDGDLEDAAAFTACYSKAWGKGMATLEVFHVSPEQVTKEAQAGEYLPKGAFMIRGKTTYRRPQLLLGVGVRVRDGYRPEVLAGSPEACAAHCVGYAVLAPGDAKTSDVAKDLRKRFGGDLDAYVRVIPAGGSRVVSVHASH